MIYVGISKDPEQRLVEHLRARTFPSFTYRIVCWIEGERAARDAEKARIKELMPRYNLKHRLREDELRSCDRRAERERQRKADERKMWRDINRRQREHKALYLKELELEKQNKP